MTSKKFNNVGAEADYTFKITPYIVYDIGSTLIFEFSRNISPKFNRGGIIECDQDEIPLQCDL